jgi:CRISPR system Cascade subunit CasE
MTGFVITKATLSPKARGIGALLCEQADGDGGHRLMWTLFQDVHDGPAWRQFLFRKSDERTYFIVSSSTPEDPHELWQLAPKPYDPRPIEGRRYSFLLRANPAIAARQGDRSSLRADAVMHAKRASKASGSPWGREQEADAALAWLFKREAALGVRFDKEECEANAYAQVRIQRKDGRSIRFSSVDYRGRLVVVDPDKLTKALLTGIGKARAFGCGLMLIRPQ